MYYKSLNIQIYCIVIVLIFITYKYILITEKLTKGSTQNVKKMLKQGDLKAYSQTEHVGVSGHKEYKFSWDKNNWLSKN